MKFYTIQDPAILDLLHNNQKWTTTEKYYTFPDDYIWVIDRMKERLKISNPS